jgi:hypothetical protein
MWGLTRERAISGSSRLPAGVAHHSLAQLWLFTMAIAVPLGSLILRYTAGAERELET